MTEEQKKRKAERQKKYRENKKLKTERAAMHPATPVDPNPISPAIRLERHLPEPIKAALEDLNGKLPGLRFLQVGRCYNGYDLCLYSEFDSREAAAAASSFTMT